MGLVMPSTALADANVQHAELAAIFANVCMKHVGHKAIFANTSELFAFDTEGFASPSLIFAIVAEVFAVAARTFASDARSFVLHAGNLVQSTEMLAFVTRTCARVARSKWLFAGALRRVGLRSWDRSLGQRRGTSAGILGMNGDYATAGAPEGGLEVASSLRTAEEGSLTWASRAAATRSAACPTSPSSRLPARARRSSSGSRSRRRGTSRRGSRG